MSNIKISFLGDIMCEHSRLNSYKINDTYNFEPIFENCTSLFKESDYIIANLETPIAGADLQYSFKDYSFNTPEEILSALKKAGVNMVTTANNHVLDRGIIGIDKTIENIKKYDLEYTGTTHSGEKPKPLIKDFFNVKIGFLSYTYGTEACYNGFYLDKNEKYRVNLLRNQELNNPVQRYIVCSKTFFGRLIRFILKRIYPNLLQKSVENFYQNAISQKKHICADIKYCKNCGCNLIVMCLHSGGQFNDYPTKYTTEIAKFCMQKGVDIIVGNHEHLIQPIDVQNKAAYCLGNFSSNYSIDRAPYDKDANCSICLHLNINETGIFSFSFSIMISKKNDAGQIITVPLYDEFCNKNCDIIDLIRLNTNAYNRFCNSKFNEVLPQKEYYL